MRDARAAVLLDAGADPQLIDVQIRLRRTLAQISTCAVSAVSAVSAFIRDGSPIAGGFLGQSSSATYAIARQGNTVAGAETR
jgi:hypothetical protein